MEFLTLGFNLAQLWLLWGIKLVDGAFSMHLSFVTVPFK